LIEGLQSALDPHGPDARVIAQIWWVLLCGATVVFALVMALATWAAFGRGNRGWLAGHAAVVAGGVAVPALVLFVLLIYTFVAAARMHAEHREAALRIEVVGEQWWWRVHYLDDDGARDFATANEIRIPVGASVELKLVSPDVLHSLWVPSLAGKLDLIPGKDNRLRLRADRAGVHRGQCAEYCGGSHAQMALMVVAEEPEAFERWRARQRAPSTQPAVASFLAHCASCHTVRGTEALGTLGPDLTHVGSRLSLGAGILPNNTGTLAAWIGSNQHLKPGNLMPEFGTELSGAQLTGLAAYLQSLR
jgi:cytochrome c oxidase subunit 2